ncbi:unnamed protein product [Penicillium egyptiacum]|uniref:Uncharacterized protein n=1 Tax=Penicillium egyptiacum TaxID=1303716 RepID=A0A9W4K9W5_9EURO|nr:unnamed protein product [Penicillium egyptiacum]
MLVIGEEPTEQITCFEICALVAVMITRLCDEEFQKHNVIPVMAVSVLGKMKVRILDSHYGPKGLVVRKTRLLDFFDENNAILNMGHIMRHMASTVKGDTKRPKNITKFQKANLHDTEIPAQGDLLAQAPKRTWTWGRPRGKRTSVANAFEDLPPNTVPQPSALSDRPTLGPRASNELLPKCALSIPPPPPAKDTPMTDAEIEKLCSFLQDYK